MLMHSVKKSFITGLFWCSHANLF